MEPEQWPALDALGVIVWVSGARQVGKSTVLLAGRQAAIQTGLSPGGMISVGRFVGDEKTGIDVMDAATGTVVQLATYHADLERCGEGIQTGHYDFSADGLAAGLRFAAAGQSADVFFADELGPLEYKRCQGWADVIPMIAARKFGCALVTVRPDLIDLARQKIGGPAGPVLIVTPENRDELAAELSEWISKRAQR